MMAAFLVSGQATTYWAVEVSASGMRWTMAGMFATWGVVWCLVGKKNEKKKLLSTFVPVVSFPRMRGSVRGDPGRVEGRWRVQFLDYGE